MPTRTPDGLITWVHWELPPRAALACKYSKRHYRRRGRKWFAYVTYKVRTHPLQIFQFYRRRFGIESSYRQR